jgi:hypothetical protein
MIFHLLYLLFALQFRNHCYLAHISLERTLQVLFGEDKKSLLGYCFSILVILILHRFDLALHASLVMIYLYSMFLFFLIIKKKLGAKMQGNFIFSFLGMSNIAYIFS